MRQGKVQVELDDVEVARAAVAALSYNASSAPFEFHINAYRSLFGRYRDHARCRAALLAMRLVGEVEELTNGFWLATPVRVVRLTTCGLLVAPLPTERLAGELKGVRRVGFGRVIPVENAVGLPEQSLESWLQQSIDSASDLIAFVNERHLSTRLQTVLASSAEYFALAQRQNPRRPSRRFVWTRDATAAADIGYAIYLCRDRVSSFSHRYFLVSRDASGVFYESSAIEDPLRLQYAAARLASVPVEYGVKVNSSSCVEVTIAEALPHPEYRLARTLSADVTRESNIRRLALLPECADAVEKQLRALGCQRISIDDEE